MDVKDFFQRPIHKGDHVAFVTHSSTSSNLETGTVIKINPKTVEIETERGSKTRKEGYKVIVMSKISAAVAPVVHGQWETNPDDIYWGNTVKRKYCTACKKEPHFDREKREFILTDYCPNCGAKMDEEEKHG